MRCHLVVNGETVYAIGSALKRIENLLFHGIWIILVTVDSGKKKVRLYHSYKDVHLRLQAKQFIFIPKTLLCQNCFHHSGHNVKVEMWFNLAENCLSYKNSHHFPWLQFNATMSLFSGHPGSARNVMAAEAKSPYSYKRIPPWLICLKIVWRYLWPSWPLGVCSIIRSPHLSWCLRRHLPGDTAVLTLSSPPSSNTETCPQGTCRSEQNW